MVFVFIGPLLPARLFWVVYINVNGILFSFGEFLFGRDGVVDFSLLDEVDDIVEAGFSTSKFGGRIMTKVRGDAVCNSPKLVVVIELAII